MIWDILEKKIIDAGLGVPGTSLFRNTMPAECKVGVMLRAPLQGIKTDPYKPGFFKTPLQAIIRHQDVVDGERLANLVTNALTVAGPEVYQPNADRGQVRISIFFPRELPIQFPHLEGNGIEWSINFVTAFAIQDKP